MSIPCLRLLVLVLFSGAPSPAWGNGQGWDALALRLSGESSALYAKVVAKLRRVPQLEAKLRAALRDDRRYLAMDVISALQIAGLLPDLMAGAEKDESGLSLNAINSLLSSRNAQFISDFYRRRVFIPALPPAARAVMLDTLGRLGTPLSLARTKAVVDEDPSPDAKSAALGYARLMLLRRGREDYLPVVASGLRARPFQIRVQALFLSSELRPAVRARLGVDCARDRSAEVRDVCRELFPGAERAP